MWKYSLKPGCSIVQMKTNTISPAEVDEGQFEKYQLLVLQKNMISNKRYDTVLLLCHTVKHTHWYRAA